MDENAYFSRVLPATMALPSHREEIPVPEGFDLGEGEVKALHLRLKVLLGCSAATVNVINSLSSRLRHRDSETWSATRARMVDKLSMYYDEAMNILQRLRALNVHPLPIPADLDKDIANITAKGLLSAQLTSAITAAGGASPATAAAAAGGASASSTATAAGAPSAATAVAASRVPSPPGSSTKALLHRLRYILPSWDCEQMATSGPSKKRI